MAKDLDLKVRISAELGEIKAGLASLKGDLAKVEQAAKKTGKGSGDGLDNLGRSLNSLKSTVLGLVTAFGAAFGAKQIIDMADQAKTLEGRLRIVTGSQEEFNRAQAALIDIANRTRNELGQTVELYSRLALATKEANVPQGELLRVTESIGKAVQLSGASAESANAAIVQLSQGLASGALRGDELNSVLEQTPRLAQAIAAGMGIGVGELRKMGQEGKITADAVIGALQSQAQVLDAEFQKLPPTVGASLTQLKNSFTELVGDLDRVSGATGGVSGGIADIAQWLREADFGPFIEATVTAKEQFVLYAKDIGRAIDELGRMFPEYFGQDGSFAQVWDFVTFTISNLPNIIRSSVQRAVVEIAAFIETVLAKLQGYAEKAKAIVTDDTIAAADERMRARLDDINKRRQESVDLIDAEVAASQEAGQAAAERFKREREERKKAAEEAKRLAQESLGAPRTVGGKKEVGGVADSLKLQEADAQEAIKNLERVFDAGKINLETYYAEKKRLSMELAQIEINEAQRKVDQADTEKEKSKALTDVEIAKRKAAALRADLDAQEAAARKKNADQIRSENSKLQSDLANLEGRTMDARMIELRAKHEQAMQEMRKTGNTEGIKLLEQMFPKEVAQVQFDEIQRKFDKLLSDLKDKEASLANRVRIGDITQGQADRQLEAARADVLQQGGGLIGEQQQFAAGNPQLADQLAKNRDALDQNKASATGLALAMQELDNSVTQMEQNFAKDSFAMLSDGIGTAFGDMISGAKTAKQAFDDMARGFAQSIAKMAAEYLAKKAILSLFGGPAGGAAGGAGGGGGFLAGLFHTGGIVGQGGVIRSVNPAMFAMAPRYHSGGVAGLKPGEVPAILKRGEEVLTQQDPRHAANGGGQQGGGGVRIINTVDPNLVSDFMASSQGEQVLINVIQRNAGAIRQAVS